MHYFVVIPPKDGDGAMLVRRLEAWVELEPGSEIFLDEIRMRVESVSDGVGGADATIVCVPVDE